MEILSNQFSAQKLLGVIINSNLIWNNNIEELVTEKAFRNHYFLVQLKREQVPCDDLVAYCARIYACPVFHSALPKSL